MLFPLGTVVGTFKKYPPCTWWIIGGQIEKFFEKIPTMGLVGNGWVNCFRTHNELTMGLLGKYPLAPSDSTILRVRGLFVSGSINLLIVNHQVSTPAPCWDSRRLRFRRDCSPCPSGTRLCGSVGTFPGPYIRHPWIAPRTYRKIW